MDFVRYFSLCKHEANAVGLTRLLIRFYYAAADESLPKTDARELIESELF